MVEYYNITMHVLLLLEYVLCGKICFLLSFYDLFIMFYGYYVRHINWVRLDIYKYCHMIIFFSKACILDIWHRLRIARPAGVHYTHCVSPSVHPSVSS